MATLQQKLSFPIKKRTSIARKTKAIYCDIKRDTPLNSDEENDCKKIISSPITPKKSLRRDQIDENDSSVTPPKQKCLGKNGEDAENLILSPKTPSTLLSKLNIGTSPIKCKETFTPKSLFNDGNVTYQKARQALHSSFPTQMPGRETELNTLQNFINDHLENKTSGTLYVSGPPGTGKTAALTKILTELKSKAKYKEAYINCASVKSAKAIYLRVAEELNLKVTGKNEKDYLSSIEHHLTSRHQPIILVLDEIDQLDSRKQAVLYTIFEWPSIPKSQFILIGIANALDLTDRTLPRLQAKCELKPKLLHFAPYTKQQIVEILSNRLNCSNVSEVFSPAAMHLLAGKVSAVSGDIRRALDISRRVVELVEHGREKTILQSIENHDSKSAGLKQVVSVLNNVYGTSQSLEDDIDDCVPLQQKLLLCSLILILKKSKNKDVTIGRLHEVYRKVCTKRNIGAVDQSEFVGLCSLIETRGIVKVNGRKEPRLNKICLEWDEDEIASVLKDKQMMSSILQDVSCLNK